MKPYFQKPNYHIILNTIFTLMFFLSIAGDARGQKQDTSVYYYKNEKTPDGFNNVVQVNTLAEADYFRTVYPSEVFHRFTINEFYKNGKIKLIGTTAAGVDPIYLNAVNIEYDGDCATYYPNGKKESILHFITGYKDGDEYLFYPDGKIYCYIKNSNHMHYQAQFGVGANAVKSLLWECYDKKGNMICQNGNGEWLFYDAAFDNIWMRGPIKNGLRNGEWHGNTMRSDSIKYTFLYDKGQIEKSMGYDKNGTSFLFKAIQEEASHRGGPPTFIQSVRNHLKWPKDENGQKVSIDTMHISFIIEKDGSLSNLGVLGEVKPEIKEALISALKECGGWTPARYYGVPFRTQMVLPMVYLSQYEMAGSVPPPSYNNVRSGDTYHIEVKYYEKMLDF